MKLFSGGVVFVLIGDGFNQEIEVTVGFEPLFNFGLVVFPVTSKIVQF